LALGLAGLANAKAVWIDKWMLWWAPGSMAAVGALRVNPVNDQASFLGLLTMIPGLTLILVTTETRFHRASVR
jgi:polysaccharide biosynthesis protein PelG